MVIIYAPLGVILGIPSLGAIHTTHAKYVQAPQVPCNYFHQQHRLIEATEVFKKVFEILDGQPSDLKYIHVILFEQYVGIMDNLMPQIIV